MEHGEQNGGDGLYVPPDERPEPEDAVNPDESPRQLLVGLVSLAVAFVAVMSAMTAGKPLACTGQLSWFLDSATVHMYQTACASTNPGETDNSIYVGFDGSQADGYVVATGDVCDSGFGNGRHVVTCRGPINVGKSLICSFIAGTPMFKTGSGETTTGLTIMPQAGASDFVVADPPGEGPQVNHDNLIASFGIAAATSRFSSHLESSYGMAIHVLGNINQPEQQRIESVVQAAADRPAQELTLCPDLAGKAKECDFRVPDGQIFVVNHVGATRADLRREIRKLGATFRSQKFAPATECLFMTPGRSGCEPRQQSVGVPMKYDRSIGGWDGRWSMAQGLSISEWVDYARAHDRARYETAVPWKADDNSALLVEPTVYEAVFIRHRQDGTSAQVRALFFFIGDLERPSTALQARQTFSMLTQAIKHELVKMKQEAMISTLAGCDSVSTALAEYMEHSLTVYNIGLQLDSNRAARAGMKPKPDSEMADSGKDAAQASPSANTAPSAEPDAPDGDTSNSAEAGPDAPKVDAAETDDPGTSPSAAPAATAPAASSPKHEASQPATSLREAAAEFLVVAAPLETKPSIWQWLPWSKVKPSACDSLIAGVRVLQTTCDAPATTIDSGPGGASPVGVRQCTDAERSMAAGVLASATKEIEACGGSGPKCDAHTRCSAALEPLLPVLLARAPEGYHHRTDWLAMRDEIRARQAAARIKGLNPTEAASAATNHAITSAAVAFFVTTKGKMRIRAQKPSSLAKICAELAQGSRSLLAAKDTYDDVYAQAGCNWSATPIAQSDWELGATSRGSSKKTKAVYVEDLATEFYPITATRDGSLVPGEFRPQHLAPVQTESAGGELQRPKPVPPVNGVTSPGKAAYSMSMTQHFANLMPSLPTMTHGTTSATTMEDLLAAMIASESDAPSKDIQRPPFSSTGVRVGDSKERDGVVTIRGHSFATAEERSRKRQFHFVSTRRADGITLTDAPLPTRALCGANQLAIEIVKKRNGILAGMSAKSSSNFLTALSEIFANDGGFTGIQGACIECLAKDPAEESCVVYLPFVHKVLFVPGAAHDTSLPSKDKPLSVSVDEDHVVVWLAQD